MSSAEQSRRALLLVASSPSDLSELEGTAKSLARRGYEITLGYFYSGSSKQAHISSLEKLIALNESEAGLRTLAIDVDQSQQVNHASIKAATGQPIERTDRSSERWTDTMLARIAKFRESLIQLWIGLRRWMQNNGSLAQYHVFLTCIRSIRRRVSRFMMIRMPLPYAVIATLQLLRIYKSYGSMFDTLLGQKNYQVILTPEDVVGPFWPMLIKAGLARRIPTVILPYTLANQEEAFKSLRIQQEFLTKYNRLAAYLFPKWRMKKDGYDAVRLPAGHVLVHQSLGIAPPDPWMMNSGNAKVICVDSQASFDYFAQAGIPKQKLKITGSVSQDSLAQLLRAKAEGLNRLRSELGLAGEKPLLLISGCPNQLTGPVPQCEFATMKDVADHLGESLRALAADYHLVVRPHPNYLEFGDLLKPHGVTVALTPTSQLVPLCDLFIAFASATIRWAAACGIPTINYDIFHYGYADFAGTEVVSTVSASGDFVALVADMKPCSDRYQRARTQGQVDAAYWSVMDGRGLERIEQVINTVMC